MEKLKKRYLLLKKIESVLASIILIGFVVIIPLLSWGIGKSNLLIFTIIISWMAYFLECGLVFFLETKTLEQFFLGGCLTDENMMVSYHVYPNCSEEMKDLLPIKSIVFQREKKDGVYSFISRCYSIKISYESGEEKMIQIPKEKLKSLHKFITLYK